METNTSHISVIIADDHTIFADGIRKILNDNDRYEVVGTAANGEEVLKYLKLNAVDIVIMDIDMPVMDGIETSEIIREYFPKTKVLIMSMHNRGGYIHNALEAGVKGYILKNISPEELDNAIDSIIDGGDYFSREVASTMATQIVSNPKNEEIIQLSRIEKRLLQLLSDGCTNDEASVKMKTSTHTIRSYRRVMMAKFNAKNNTHLVSIAIKKGYIS